MVDALALAKDSLDLAREAQNEATGNPRRGAVVMLTDGSNQPDYGGDEQTIAQAGQLKAAGYLVVAAGFGEADAIVLGAMASRPLEGHAFVEASAVRPPPLAAELCL